MALNYKTLLTRSISGLVFVVLLMGSLWWNYIAFTVFFFVVAMLALNEFFNLSVKLGYRPYYLPGYAISVLLIVSFINPQLFFWENIFENCLSLKVWLVIAPCLVLTAALFSKREQPIHNAVFTLAGILYVALPMSLIHELVIDPTGTVAYTPEILTGIIFLIWSNDTFAYLGGSLFGKHKMIERVSPGKTWEGTATGVLCAFGISFLVQKYVDGQHGWYWPLFGVAVPVLATLGDLIESMIKRQAGVKDSGQLMPGHGGALDRFDSLLFVIPFAAVFLYLLRFGSF